MKGVNLVVLLGRVGSDPEVKEVGQSGKSVARFSIATSEVWTDRDGQKQEKTEWHRIVAWGKLAEIIGQYVKKGSAVHVQGKITTRSWEDDQGNKKYSTEIIASQVQFLSSGAGPSSERRDRGDNRGNRRDDYEDNTSYQNDEPDFSSDDDIPF